MMAILDLQRRLREAGRIRIGQQVPTSNGRTRPEKLKTFRITSRDRSIVEQASERWGGEVKPWASPDGDQWEVVTQTAELAVLIPPGEMAFSQFYESWTAGGCKKRCDGRWDVQRDTACDCDPEHRDCAIHSRLSVLLPDIGGAGLYRLDTSGYYAATELGGAVELCQMISGKSMIGGRLRLEQRSVKRDVNGKVETRRFAVPVLDIDIPMGALSAGRAEIGVAPPTAEVGTGATFQPVPASLPAAPSGTIAEQVAATPPARRTSTPAIKATGITAGPICVRCGGSLIGCNVGIEQGLGRVHKDGCPSAPEGGDATASTDGNAGVHEPPADPPPMIEIVTPDAQAADPDGVKRFAIDARKAFARVYDEAPRGEKTMRLDRLRHAFVWALSGSISHHVRTIHYADLMPVDKQSARRELGFIISGDYTYEYTDQAAIFTFNGAEVVVPWSEIEGGE